MGGKVASFLLRLDLGECGAGGAKVAGWQSGRRVSCELGAVVEARGDNRLARFIEQGEHEVRLLKKINSMRERKSRDGSSKIAR